MCSVKNSHETRLIRNAEKYLQTFITSELSVGALGMDQNKNDNEPKTRQHMFALISVACVKCNLQLLSHPSSQSLMVVGPQLLTRLSRKGASGAGSDLNFE